MKKVLPVALTLLTGIMIGMISVLPGSAGEQSLQDSSPSHPQVDVSTINFLLDHKEQLLKMLDDKNISLTDF
jgi:hypothetical protein